MDKQQRIKEIDKKIAKVAIMDAPGTIMVGLGLYAKFGANGDAFIQILNDQTFVDSMLILGAAIMFWGAYTTYTLIRERARLNDDLNVQR